MKEKIEEVQGYFRNKILTGEFSTEEITEYVMTIKVDGEYVFNLWIGNITDINDSVKLYQSQFNFMDVEFSTEERISIREMINPVVKSFRQTELLEKKRAELAELEKEFSNDSE